MMAVLKLVKVGTGFPAIHNDFTGSQMLEIGVIVVALYPILEKQASGHQQ